jgi:hypothetical protein
LTVALSLTDLTSSHEESVQNCSHARMRPPISMRVETSTFPNQVGMEQKRTLVVSANELRLTSLSFGRAGSFL